MLALAREARGYSQSELADLAQVDRSAISKFEAGTYVLPAKDVAAVLPPLNFPESLFYAEPHLIAPALYRRRDKVPVKLLTQTDAVINLYALGIRRLLNAIRFAEPKLPVYTVTENDTPEKLAEKLRRSWKLPKGPVADLTKLLEQNGIITLPVDFNTERIDSRSMIIDNKYPVIFYNALLLGDRLRFTLAHELAHLILHTQVAHTNVDRLSHEANLFAASFLMPKQDIIEDLHKADRDEYGTLKLKWGASMHALVYRAQDTGAITEQQKDEIIKRFNVLRIRKREPKEFDLAIERGHLLRDLITSYRSKQKMTVKEMAEFFYMYEDEFLSRYNTK